MNNLYSWLCKWLGPLQETAMTGVLKGKSHFKFCFHQMYHKVTENVFVAYSEPERKFNLWYLRPMSLASASPCILAWAAVLYLLVLHTSEPKFSLIFHAPEYSKIPRAFLGPQWATSDMHTTATKPVSHLSKTSAHRNLHDVCYKKIQTTLISK